MRKPIAYLLTLLLMLSVCSMAVSAEEAASEASIALGAEEMLSDENADTITDSENQMLEDIYSQAAVGGQIPAMLPSSFVREAFSQTGEIPPVAMFAASSEMVTPLEEPCVIVPQTWYRLFWKNGTSWQMWGGKWWIQKIPYFNLSDGRTGYCIEPFNDNAAVGSSRVPMDWSEIQCKWSGSGGSFEVEKQKGIALALAFGAPNNGKSSKEAKIATAALVWDMACGYRDLNGALRFSGYPSPFGKVLKGNQPAIYAEYQALLNALANRGKVPSFAAKFASQIGENQTHTLQYNGNTGLYEISLYDSNGVLEHFHYESNLEGLNFSASGNTLQVTATPEAAAQLSSGVRIRNRGKEVEVGPEVCAVWCSSSGADTQLMVSLTDNIDPVPSCFNLKADTFGTAKFIKTTNTGGSLSGWKIGLYRDSGCRDLIDTYTTGMDGTVSTGNLLPGTYYAKEVDESSIYPYWRYDDHVETVVIRSGETAEARFHNDQYGWIQFHKSTNTGEYLAGWRIELYSDAECTRLVGQYVTDHTGTASTEYLYPGTYYAKEASIEYPYWECDHSIKKIEVKAGGITSDETTTFHNTHYGDLKFIKTTNTGGSLSGWKISLYRNTECTDLVDTYITGAEGTVSTGNLLPGTYYAKEVDESPIYPYWRYDDHVETVVIRSGETAEARFHNDQLGKIRFTKSTNTGNHLNGWTIYLYSDSQCSQLVGTYVTGADGTVTTDYLLPGDYYAAEAAIPDPYWDCDSSVKRITVTAGQTTTAYESTNFHNVHNGRMAVKKIMATDGSLQGWIFQITDAEGKKIPGSPFTSGEDGTILTGNLLPGTYTVTEIIPEDSLYYCKSSNPQTVEITPGETAHVEFTNALRPGKIQILKTDPSGNPLSGAKFLLEWSKDGSPWEPVFYSENEDVVLGGCSASVENGCILIGADGLVEWGNLYPGIEYRITEVEAPAGYQLLSQTAWEGNLPAENLTVELHVVNQPAFVLPKTGSTMMARLPAALILCGVVCMGAIWYLKKRR